MNGWRRAQRRTATQQERGSRGHTGALRGGRGPGVLLVGAAAAALSLTGLAGLPAAAHGSNAIIRTATELSGWAVDLDAVQAALVDSPTGVPAHFATVLGGPTEAQQLPVTLNATILSVLGDGTARGSYILFNADMTDPVMQALGGIASGMSGSPLSIQVGGAWRVVGAVSYGYDFARNGVGLATPIKAMVDTENANGLARANPDASIGEPERSPRMPRPVAATYRLPSTVTVDGTTISAVRVDPRPAVTAASGATASGGTAVMRPLGAVTLSGVPADSPIRRSTAFRKLTATLQARGSGFVDVPSVLPGASWQTPLVPGGAVGMAYARGEVTVGSVGTITYVHPSTTAGRSVIGAFGHPSYGLGADRAWLTNAWIAGTVGSNESSFKLPTLGANRGSFTEDRQTGVYGAAPDTLASVDVVTTVQRKSGSSLTPLGSTTTSIAADQLEHEMLIPELASVSIGQSVYDALESRRAPGTVDVALSVTAKRGSATEVVTHTFRAADRSDALMFSDIPWSIAGFLSQFDQSPDDANAWELSAINATVTLQSEVKWRGLSRFAAPTGLRTGANALGVVLHDGAGVTRETTPVSLTLPSVAGTSGMLMTGSQLDVDYFLCDRDGWWEDEDPEADAETPASRIAWIRDQASDGVIQVNFVPIDASCGDDAVAARTSDTGFALQGSLESWTTSMSSISPASATVTSGGSIRVSGRLSGPDTPGRIIVDGYDQVTRTWTRVGTMAFTPDPMSEEDEPDMVFSGTVKPTYITTYRFRYEGNADYLGSEQQRTYGARPVVSLTPTRASTTQTNLTVRLTPATATSVTVDRLVSGAWTPVFTGTTSVGGTIARAVPTRVGTTYTWRVRTTANPALSAATSASTVYRAR